MFRCGRLATDGPLPVDASLIGSHGAHYVGTIRQSAGCDRQSASPAAASRKPGLCMAVITGSVMTPPILVRARQPGGRG